MDEDHGSQYADREAEIQWYAERNMCPECETKYDIDGYCECDEAIL